MLNTKSCVILSLLLFSSVLFSQQKFQTKDDLTLSGDLDLNSLIYTGINKQLGNEPVTQIEITFNVPLMKDSKKLVSNLDHISMFDDVNPDDESTQVDAVINVPFKSSEYTDKNGHIDVDGYIVGMTAAMGQFTAASNDGFEQKTDPIAPTCSGMSVGSTIEIKTTNCFGTTDNTYNCKMANGQNNWLLTRNIFIPNDSACNPE